MVANHVTTFCIMIMNMNGFYKLTEISNLRVKLVINRQCFSLWGCCIEGKTTFLSCLLHLLLPQGHCQLHIADHFPGNQESSEVFPLFLLRAALRNWRADKEIHSFTQSSPPLSSQVQKVESGNILLSAGCG